MDRINQHAVDRTPNPPQVMSPSVGEEQIHATMSAARPAQDDESQSRIKEERKEEEVTPKSEAATVGTKDGPAEHDSEAANCRVSSFCRPNSTTIQP